MAFAPNTPKGGKIRWTNRNFLPVFSYISDVNLTSLRRKLRSELEPASRRNEGRGEAPTHGIGQQKVTSPTEYVRVKRVCLSILVIL